MKQILVLHLKHGDMYIDATNEQAAMLLAFKIHDEEGFYHPNYLNNIEIGWYTKAKTGDGLAAKKLLISFRNSEYQNWQICNVQDPKG